MQATQNASCASSTVRLRDSRVRCRVCHWTGTCSGTEVLRRLRHGRAVCCGRPLVLLIPADPFPRADRSAPEVHLRAQR